MPDHRPWQETNLIQFPIAGGIDTTSAPAFVGMNRLTIAQNMIFGERKTWKKRGGLVQQNSSALASPNIKKLIDYWKAGSSGAPSQRLVAVAGTKFYSSSDAGASYSDISGTVSHPNDDVVAHAVVGDSLVMTFAATVPMVWAQTGNVAALTGSPPNGSVCAEHLGRLWMNEKTDPHRIHFTGVTGTGDGDPTLWGTANGGGSFTIEPDDGDPVGITALWQHNDQLYVAKQNKIYKIEGRTSDTFRGVLVINGIGCIAHNQVVPIGNDVLFPSLLGYHSLGIVAQTGTLSREAYISDKIHKTFHTEINLGRMKHGHGVFIPELNSVIWSVPLTAQTTNTEALVHSLSTREWTRWNNFRGNALLGRYNSSTNKIELYAGDSLGNTFKQVNTTLTDYGSTAIDMRLKSGQIYPDLKFGHKWAFKKFVLLLYPKGTSQVTFTYRIDSQKNSSNAIISTSSTEDQGTTGTYTVMGSSFIMGTNLMGEDVFVQPLVIDLKGTGQAFEWEIQNSANQQDLEIGGYYIEIEPSSPQRNRV